MTITTYRNMPPVEHPNTVVSYLGLGTERIPAPADNAVNGYRISDEQLVSNPGDHILLIAAFRPGNSGWMICDGDRTNQIPPTGDNTFAFGAHLTAHGQINVAGTLINGYGYAPSFSFGPRCFCVYIDRENGNLYEATDGTGVVDKDDDTVTPVLAGITTKAGAFTVSDADYGQQTFQPLVYRNMSEHGPLRIIKWSAGNAPPLALIQTAMEWMWYEWSLRENCILYNDLFLYT